MESLMNVSDITASSATAQAVQRTTLVMAKTLRIQREQADATVALIEQATPSTGRIIDVRA
jgi:hypothetical protein